MGPFILLALIAIAATIIVLSTLLAKEKQRSEMLIQTTAETIENSAQEYEKKNRALENDFSERNRMLEKQYQNRIRENDAKLQETMEDLEKKEERFKEELSALKEIRRDDALIFASIIAERVREGDSHVIVPLQVMLDELESEFGYSKPGKILAEARKQTRKLVQQNFAAACSSTDERYCAAATEFIRSIFDEKVDAILKAVSASDYTKGAKDIKDVRDTLNTTAKALFDTTVTKEYSESRMKELKALIVVLGFRERAREEQRAIREQMRDEEKARREAEKLLREAAKMKAESERQEAELQARLDLATGAEKEKYETILADLRAKIKEQEDRELQAKSLAEFTKRGHVYVISNIGSFGDDVLKIGMTRRLFPEERIDELGNASVPFPFDIHAMINSDDAPALEAGFHREFNDRRVNKVNSRKEFFRVRLDEVRAFLDQESIDPAKAKFTMLAEARQYRESQAIEALPDKEKEKALSSILAEDEKELASGIAEEDIESPDED